MSCNGWTSDNDETTHTPATRPAKFQDREFRDLIAIEPLKLFPLPVLLALFSIHTTLVRFLFNCAGLSASYSVAIDIGDHESPRLTFRYGAAGDCS